MKLEPGWLMRTCHEAHIDVMRDNSPAAVKHLGISSDAIATESDAAELYAKMATRFKAWTGRSLADFATNDTPLGG
jgi:hypothetical protein